MNFLHFSKIDISELNENSDQISIPQLIIDCLSKCDSDIINDVKESICLIGGTTLFKGFVERLKNELTHSFNNNFFNL